MNIEFHYVADREIPNVGFSTFASCVNTQLFIHMSTLTILLSYNISGVFERKGKESLISSSLHFLI